MNPRTPALRRRFSLVEIMAVIVIIGLLASTVTVSVMGYMKDARRTLVKKDMESIVTAVSLFKMRHGKWPDSLDDLRTNPGLTNWQKGLNKDPIDPWDEEYVYQKPGADDDIEIVCWGSDRQGGGTPGTEEEDLLYSKLSQEK